MFSFHEQRISKKLLLIWAVVTETALFFQTVNNSLDFSNKKINNNDSNKFNYNDPHFKTHCKHCVIHPQ